MIGKNNNDEYVLEGYAVHDSWKSAWPQAIARAWYFEYLLEKSGLEINYNKLKEKIPEGLKKTGFDNLLNIVNSYDKRISNLFLNLEVDRHDGNNKEDSFIDQITKCQEKYNCKAGDNLFGGNETNNNSKELSEGKLLDELNVTILKILYQEFLEFNLPVINYENTQQFNTAAKELNENLTILKKASDSNGKNDKWLTGFKEEGDIESFVRDYNWYKKLLCHKSEMVLDALMEEGFIIDAMSNPPIGLEKSLSSRIIVRKPDQEYVVTPKRYKNDKDSCSYSKNNDRNYRISVINIPDPSGSNDKRRNFYGSRKNGWNDKKGLNHVLVLTLPPKPDKIEEFCIAVTDYEAAGKIYPFTMT